METAANSENNDNDNYVPTIETTTSFPGGVLLEYVSEAIKPLAEALGGSVTANGHISNNHNNIDNRLLTAAMGRKQNVVGSIITARNDLSSDDNASHAANNSQGMENKVVLLEKIGGLNSKKIDSLSKLNQELNAQCDALKQSLAAQEADKKEESEDYRSQRQEVSGMDSKIPFSHSTILPNCRSMILFSLPLLTIINAITSTSQLASQRNQLKQNKQIIVDLQRENDCYVEQSKQYSLLTSRHKTIVEESRRQISLHRAESDELRSKLDEKDEKLKTTCSELRRELDGTTKRTEELKRRNEELRRNHVEMEKVYTQVRGVENKSYYKHHTCMHAHHFT